MRSNALQTNTRNFYNLPYLTTEMLDSIRYRTLLMPRGELVEVRRPISAKRERLSNSLDGGKELVLFRLYCDSDGEGG